MSKGYPMKEKSKDDMLFAVYMTIVLILAVIYFTVPERSDFLNYQLQWWGEMWEVIKGG